MNLGSSLQFPSGSEIILSKMEHETNAKPWLFMAERLGLTVKWWASPKEDGLKLTAENLKPLLSDKVKFVACTHVSNILGTIHDVKSIAEAVHSAGALFCVDGVSYAPHRAIDVKDFGVDFYAFSWYKVRPESTLLPCYHDTNGMTQVYGPHIAVRQHIPLRAIFETNADFVHSSLGPLRQQLSPTAHETLGSLLQPYQNS